MRKKKRSRWVPDRLPDVFPWLLGVLYWTLFLGAVYFAGFCLMRSCS